MGSTPGSCCCPRTAKATAASSPSRSAKTSPCPRCRNSGWSGRRRFPARAKRRAPRVSKVANVEHPARHLSGGNQQKMVLAKWMDTGADVFIFDEPTQGIDIGGKEDVYRLMTGLAERGKGVIFISSEFTELVGTCGRVLVMREGRMVER